LPRARHRFAVVVFVQRQRTADQFFEQRRRAGLDRVAATRRLLLPRSGLGTIHPARLSAPRIFYGVEMVNVVPSTKTAAPASAAASSAAVAATIGQSVDAEIAVLKSRVAVIEASAKTDWSDVKQWFSTNWPHFVSWATGVAVAAKVGVFADLAKLI
jgi:hypothetical protein